MVIAELLAAESAMLEAWAPLNELAAMHRDQKSPGLLKRLAVARSIRKCEMLSEETAVLLTRIEQ